MRYRHVILVALALLAAAAAPAIVPALAENAAAPGNQPALPNAPVLEPIPIQGSSPETSSPAVYLPTAKPDISATVVDSGLTTATVSRGSLLDGYAVIRNNGQATINDATARVVVTQRRPNAPAITLISTDQPVTGLNIAPGDQKRIGFAVSVPGNMAPGAYDVQATLQAGGQQINAFTQTVTVT